MASYKIAFKKTNQNGESDWFIKGWCYGDLKEDVLARRLTNINQVISGNKVKGNTYYIFTKEVVEFAARLKRLGCVLDDTQVIKGSYNQLKMVYNDTKICIRNPFALMINMPETEFYQTMGKRTQSDAIYDFLTWYKKNLDNCWFLLSTVAFKEFKKYNLVPQFDENPYVDESYQPGILVVTGNSRSDSGYICDIKSSYPYVLKNIPTPNRRILNENRAPTQEELDSDNTLVTFRGFVELKDGHAKTFNTYRDEFTLWSFELRDLLKDYDFFSVEWVNVQRYDLSIADKGGFVDKWFLLRKSPDPLMAASAKGILNRAVGCLAAYGAKPISSYVNAFARCRLREVIRANLDRWMYSDTDSVILSGDEPPIIPDGKVGKQLGNWDIEHASKIYVKTKKCYQYYTDDGEKVMKASGAKRGTYDDIDNVKYDIIRDLKKQALKGELMGWQMNI